MEFPELGKHCYVSECKQLGELILNYIRTVDDHSFRLDFLPIRCDACSETFCVGHYHYQGHSCPNSYLKDVQVPVCPLCNQPVPVKRGQLPDIGKSLVLTQYLRI